MRTKNFIQLNVEATNNEATVTAHVVPVGRTLLTKDEYLPNNPAKVNKTNGGNPKSKRWVAVIDKNAREELAVVKLTTQVTPNTTPLPTYQKGNGKQTNFKHFVETEDDEGKPIVVDGKKFKENHAKYDLSSAEVHTVHEVVYTSARQAKANRKKYNSFVKRK